MDKKKAIRDAFREGGGVLRLAPIFLPRRFNKPGRRLKLHPDDYFALGTARGAMKERWFSSVIPAMNGPLAPPDEGMSYVALDARGSERLTLKDFADELGAELIGSRIYDAYGGWPMYSKYFDYEEPLFHHLHLDAQAAARVGRSQKPEAYYFPKQLNNYPGTFPHTYFGFAPETTKDQVRERLLNYENDDNRITELSRAYRIELGTGWYTPPGVVHAPGSYLTYEPQWNSDVNSIYQNVVSGEVYSYDFLCENCPPDRTRDIDYIMSFMDWEENVRPDYKARYFRPPVECLSEKGCAVRWVTYGNEWIAAKEVTVSPGCEVVYKDDTSFGCVFVQGCGKFGPFRCQTPTLIRFGGMAEDEFFVSADAARAGVRIENHSAVEDLVFLAHFPAIHPKTPKV